MSGLPRRQPPQSTSSQSSRHIVPSEDDDVTWLDFLRTAGRTVPATSAPLRPPPPPLPRSDSADRKRPLTGASPERRSPPHRVVWTGTRPSQVNPPSFAAAGSTRDTAIDLTSPPRRPSIMSRDLVSNEGLRASGQTIIPTIEQRNRPSFSGRRASDNFTPRWQPDSDVDRCPICKTDFSFWYRKHHCRKCGRVVCAACSPHRITIPRQYIVENPHYSNGELSLISPHANQTAGGEVVRVCNPCVPDPWTPDAPSEESSREGNIRRDGAGQSHRPEVFRPVPPPPPFNDNRTRPPPLPSGDFSRSLPQGQSSPNWAFQDAYIRPAPLPPTNQPRRSGHRYTQSSSSAAFPHSHQPNTTRAAAASSSVSPPPAPPRRIIREEDECPVCGSELPPGESIRETHIQECINARFSSTPSSHQPRAPPPPPPSGRNASPNISTSLPHQIEPTASRPRATSYRPRGMAIYRATEKDCLTEEGEPQECVICFEEFQPGDEMGRMECLCKFHRTCIRAWWETKGVGSCPTHMLHDD